MLCHISIYCACEIWALNRQRLLLINPTYIPFPEYRQPNCGFHFLANWGVFLSVNPKTDFRSKNGFRVPFGKSKSGFLIWWILFEQGFIGFEIRRIQIQINGLVIYAVPFTVDPKLVRWSSGTSSWSIPIDAVEFLRCCHLPQNIWKH